MQTVLNNTDAPQGKLIFQHQVLARRGVNVVAHETIRAAVRAWAAKWHSKEAVAAEIIAAWRERGGEDMGFHDNHQRNAQKIFRWLDGDSQRCVRRIQSLTPAILDVLPLEFRAGVVPDDRMTRVAVATKECSEAKQAALLGAPVRELEKEIREGIESLVRLAPPDRWGVVMASVAALFGNCL